MSVSMSTEKRIRRSNFSEQELTVLTDEVTTHNDVLFAPFSPIITNKRKTDLWENIAEKVSAVSSSRRNGADVRKKWNELKCHTRKKAQATKRELKKTGGGPAPTPLTDLEHKVICLIPTCQIDGIPGGVESGLSGNDPDSGDVPDYPDFDAFIPVETENSQSVLASPTGDIQKTGKRNTTVPKSISPRIQMVVDLEMEKLQVLRDIQRDGHERLDVEKKRLAIEEKRLSLDEEILALMKTKSLSSPFTLSPMIKFS